MPNTSLYRLSVAAFLIVLVTNTYGVTPVTPRFTRGTHAELLAGLTQAQLPDVAHNSVVIAITQALGFAPSHGKITYSTTYVHLPTVTGQVTKMSDRCSQVEARAWMPNEPEEDAVSVDGTYCLVGIAEWESQTQRIGRLHR